MDVITDNIQDDICIRYVCVTYLATNANTPKHE